jgi:hypothetical protein
MDEGTGISESGKEGWARVLCNLATQGSPLPKDQFKREVEKELAGRETEPWEIPGMLWKNKFFRRKANERMSPSLWCSPRSFPTVNSQKLLCL